MERLLEMMRQMDESSSGEEEEAPLLEGESESEEGEPQLPCSQLAQCVCETSPNLLLHRTVQLRQ